MSIFLTASSRTIDRADRHGTCRCYELLPFSVGDYVEAVEEKDEWGPRTDREGDSSPCNWFVVKERKRKGSQRRGSERRRIACDG